MYQLTKLKAAKFEALFRASQADLDTQYVELRASEDRRQSLERGIQVLEEQYQEDINLGERSKPIEGEVEALWGEVGQMKSNLDEMVQRAQKAVENGSIVEAENVRLRAQVVRHEAEVARVRLEARDRYAATVRDFISKMKADTGKTYKIKL